MPTDTVTLPTTEQMPIYFLAKWPELGNLLYLQCIRSGGCTEESAPAVYYRSMAWKYFAMLASTVHSSGVQYDALVTPPSSRDDAVPYKEMLAKTGALDLSDRFSREPKVSVGQGATVDELTAALKYQAMGDESEIQSLVIVDDSLSNGTTVAAILHHLRRAGLSPDCKIAIATAVWLPPDESSSSKTASRNGSTT
ncbi:phosphoribosyltransferase [Mesorhizobium sp.]|uniref:phosphoribosyltransferase n=1 Tax=Mesorhizobium sp. TaxID=1871066 RepID=UPI00257DEADE|nr:phosphoribosyltransferase [Mesorhizobium sp.]